MLLGCHDTNLYEPPPPPQVTVARPVQQEIIDFLEYTGTTAPYESVEIRARVKGQLESIPYMSLTADKSGETPSSGSLNSPTRNDADAGSSSGNTDAQPSMLGTDVDDVDVNKVDWLALHKVSRGDILFTIEPDQYIADLDMAKAEVAAAEAKVQLDSAEYVRYEQLLKKNAIAEADFERVAAQKKASEAALDAAKAQVNIAALNKSYTDVICPIDGRISERLVDVGNLVGEGQATLLATVTRYDPMYVNFYMTAKAIREVQTALGAAAKSSDTQIPVFIRAENAKHFRRYGTMENIDLGVDPGTGTRGIRAIFVNQDLASDEEAGVAYDPSLSPGEFVRVRLPFSRPQNALLVPESSLGTDQQGRYLMLVVDNVVVQTRVEVGAEFDGLRVILPNAENGITAESLIVTRGLQRARDGAEVETTIEELAPVQVDGLDLVKEYLANLEAD